MLRASAKLAIDLTTQVLHELSEQIGETDANALLLYMEGEGDSKGGSGILASLAPLINVTKVGRGEMSRTEYLAQFGHRGPKECELSAPQPSESPEWLDLLLSQYKTSEVGLDELLDERRVKYEAAWQRFLEHAPGKVRKMCRKLSEAALLGRRREAVRSEVVRVFGVIRAFALRVGEITGLGDGVFFIYRDEMLDLLSGDHSAAGYIQARRSTYEKLSAFPPYPGLIRGRFDPILWMQDPGRRSDIFDSQAPAAVPETDTITGFAGSAGRIQGVVRRLENFEECDQFQKGEILVASTTNVGWTPLFPLAAAIITDIGAPLSHAAIVARELGIPAVVGCGNAMMRLKTGDQVIVDGAQGAVRII